LGEESRAQQEFTSATDRARQVVSLLQESVIDQQTASLALKGFMPFEADSAKHKRYVEFLERSAGLRKIDPGIAKKSQEELVELRDFAKSARIFKPLTSMMAARFASSSQTQTEEHSIIPKSGLYIPDPKDLPPRENKQVEQEKIQKQDERMKPKMHRTEKVWAPQRLLCKRFNIADPYPDGVPTFQQGGSTRLERKAQAVEKEAVMMDQLKRLRNQQLPGSSQPSQVAEDQTTAGTSSQGEAQKPSAPMPQAVSKKREEQEEEISQDARPSIDIFKAIFENSDSEEEEEEEEEEKEKKPTAEKEPSEKHEPKGLPSPHQPPLSEKVAHLLPMVMEKEEEVFGPRRPPSVAPLSTTSVTTNRKDASRFDPDSNSDSESDSSSSEEEEKARKDRKKHKEKKAKKEKKERKEQKHKDRKKEKKHKKDDHREEKRHRRSSHEKKGDPDDGFLLPQDDPQFAPRRPKAADFM